MGRTRRWLGTLLAVYYAYMVEYRAELLFWMLSGSLPIILMGAWIEAAQGDRFALGAVEFARYFISVFLVRQFTIVWVVWEFEKEVVQGKLSLRLLQPLDPGWHHFVSHISERLARLPLVFVLLVFCFWLYPQVWWWPGLGRVLAGAIAITAAFILRFLFQYTTAMLAFWTERASAIEEMFFIFYVFLSGYIAPLAVFPETVSQIALWTPFPYMLYVPAALLAGLPVNLGQAVLVVTGWSWLLFLLNRWAWRRGLRHYSGMGA